MDLRLSEQQELIRGLARQFLETEWSIPVSRHLAASPEGHSPALWQKMADLGLLGVAIPEEYGGAGLTFLELAVQIEEHGRFHLSGPFFTTMVLCALPIARCGTEAQKVEYLRAITAGNRILTYAETEGAGWDSDMIHLAATATGDGYLLDGMKQFVPHACLADDLLVVARTGNLGEGELTLFLVNARTPGIDCERLETIDNDHQCHLKFNGVRVPAENILGQLGEGGAIVSQINQFGLAAKCAEMLGGAEKVLEMTVDYAQQRTQFGRPIGSFQAVQHHCANMAVDVTSSRHITYEAVWRLSEGLNGSEHLSMAKSWVSDAYQRVCALGHQVHGAVGFTKEHDMQTYFRHAKAAELTFGDADHHRERLAQQLGL